MWPAYPCEVGLIQNNLRVLEYDGEVGNDKGLVCARHPDVLMWLVPTFLLDQREVSCHRFLSS